MTGTIYPKREKTKYKIISVSDGFSGFLYRLKYKRHFSFWFIKFSLWFNVGLDDNRHKDILEKFIEDNTKVERFFELIAANKKRREEQRKRLEETTYYN